MKTTGTAMRVTDNPIEPVRKVRRVELPPERAFDLFTSRMGEWWPLSSHSIAAEKAVDVRFEGRVGGQVVELTGDGIEHTWANVLAWDPPHRFVVAWHPSQEPVAASILEVRFEATDSGTLLHLEHRGWEEYGTDEGSAARDQYVPGWDIVLGPYLAHVAALSSPQESGLLAEPGDR